MPGFWQREAGPCRKVIKLMRHLNCWRMVCRVIKSSDGVINPLVLPLFVSTKDKPPHTRIFLVFLSSSSAFDSRKWPILFYQTFILPVFVKTSQELSPHLWHTVIIEWVVLHWHWSQVTDNAALFVTLSFWCNVYYYWRTGPRVGEAKYIHYACNMFTKTFFILASTRVKLFWLCPLQIHPPRFATHCVTMTKLNINKREPSSPSFVRAQTISTLHIFGSFRLFFIF